MKSTYTALTFTMQGFDPEIWMALLSEWPFESFHEEEGRVTAYIMTSQLSPALLNWINSQQEIRFASFESGLVEEENWNAVWERSFQPVAVRDYCYIRADFHPPAPAGYRHVIHIAPKMAFGTGHHATTWMMIDAMSHIHFQGKDVLDFGCGTGILSVLAALEGAATVTGIDIQPEAIENSIEHADINQVRHQCRFLPGDLQVVSGHTYDILLANINTHVIAATLSSLKGIVRPGGFVLFSGMMTHDIPFIREQMDFSPLREISRQERQDWIQLTMFYPSS